MSDSESDSTSSSDELAIQYPPFRAPSTHLSADRFAWASTEGGVIVYIGDVKTGSTSFGGYSNDWRLQSYVLSNGRSDLVITVFGQHIEAQAARIRLGSVVILPKFTAELSRNHDLRLLYPTTSCAFYRISEERTLIHDGRQLLTERFNLAHTHPEHWRIFWLNSLLMRIHQYQLDHMAALEYELPGMSFPALKPGQRRRVSDSTVKSASWATGGFGMMELSSYVEDWGVFGRWWFMPGWTAGIRPFSPFSIIRNEKHAQSMGWNHKPEPASHRLPLDVWKLIIAQCDVVDRYVLSHTNGHFRRLLSQGATWSLNGLGHFNATSTAKHTRILPRVALSLALNLCVSCLSSALRQGRKPKKQLEASFIFAAPLCTKCATLHSFFRLEPAPTTYRHPNLPLPAYQRDGRRVRNEHGELVPGKPVNLYWADELEETRGNAQEPPAKKTRVTGRDSVTRK
jgi:hypothetical protein